ncbi:MAG: endonuclease/exonuclease/phosphatase family protein [Candidatus Omnitrophica bacterium]|nr:endonuclease/exonuclease/phosphatase family protein [Candidatus Omnitrophota bacterium]
MLTHTQHAGWIISLVIILATPTARSADTFSVATYNLENYLDHAEGGRKAKSDSAKAKIRESICAMAPDVLAVQEIGDQSALLELRESLKAEGQFFPYWEHVSGLDTNIHLAVLSKFPVVAKHSHSNESFLLHGRRFRVSRGFAELDIQVNQEYTFTLFTAHLKSKRRVPEASEADLREQEAFCLRKIVNARLSANPNLNLVVLGDFNDTKDSRPFRLLRGRGQRALIDIRPAERNGDNQPNPIPSFSPATVTWTYYYGKQDTYSRIDFILLSRGMARELDPKGTYVLTLPNWGTGSDHRPIIARFSARDQ